jgi:hypothetical protein
MPHPSSDSSSPGKRIGRAKPMADKQSRPARARPGRTNHPDPRPGLSLWSAPCTPHFTPQIMTLK